ncbi:MAG TPA: hypothetical protein VHY76_12055 [Acetobacteraceae bacterium]|jgi:hypothetical protein|nr:hypothetical protein [Acetobacteraceae bacterium]
MRASSLLCLMLLAAAPVPAHAQSGPLRPAPVPTLGGAQVRPSEGAGRPGAQADNAGPANATPFSSVPTQTLTFGDQGDPHPAATAKGGLVSAPNVSR